MSRHRPTAAHRQGALALVLIALSLLGCQSTITGARVLLERTGSGSERLPSFTSRGSFDVAYSYDTCSAGVTGMTLNALVGSETTPTTLLQTVAPDASGSVAGRKAGPITLEIISHCRWKITVRG